MVDFNKAPYYDDFDENKKFLQVLFQPGRPVQARELTQLQSILQNQIEQIIYLSRGLKFLMPKLRDLNKRMILLEYDLLN